MRFRRRRFPGVLRPINLPRPPFLGPRMRRAALGDRPRQRLNRAHQMLAAGDFEAAARIFSELAELAESRGIPGRAAQLHLQAGRARLELGDGPAALLHAREALGLFLANGNYQRAAQALPRILHEFHVRGFEAEADALEAEARKHFEQAGQPFGSAAPSAPRRRGSLPAHCPYCGGDLRPDEVEWLDENSVECDYCGSLVKVEG